MKNRTLLVRLGLLLGLLCIVAGLLFSLREPPDQPVYALSLLLHTCTADGANRLEAGAQRAADLYRAELTLVTLSEPNSTEEQSRLIERELASDAQAILLSAAAYHGLDQALSLCSNASVPVFTLTSGVSSSIPFHLSADQTQMGQLLAREVCKRASMTTRIAIVHTGLQRSDLQARMNGLMAYFDQQTQPYLIIDAAGSVLDPSDLVNRLRQHEVDTVIALDLPILEALCASSDAKDFTLYGFDSSEAVLGALDSGCIAALCVSDEYALGYLAVQTACTYLREQTLPDAPAIRSLVVNRRTMYQNDNQWILFPLS